MVELLLDVGGHELLRREKDSIKAEESLPYARRPVHPQNRSPSRIRTLVDRAHPQIDLERSEPSFRNFSGPDFSPVVPEFPPEGSPSSLIGATPARSTRMEAFHAVLGDEGATTPATSKPEAGKAPPRACPVCGLPMSGRKVSACSAACRTARSRQGKKDELLLRIRVAREALRAAEAAIAAMEEVASSATVISWM